MLDPNTNREVSTVVLINRVEGLRARNQELEDEITGLQFSFISVYMTNLIHAFQRYSIDLIVYEEKKLNCDRVNDYSVEKCTNKNNNNN